MDQAETDVLPTTSVPRLISPFNRSSGRCAA
jgi:hypothetical protein